MRLALIANPNSAHIQRWVRYFAEQGHEIHVISEVAGQAPPPSGVVLHRLQAPRISLARFIALGLGARRVIYEIQPDLVHAHTVSPSGWLGAMAGYHPLMVTAWGSDLLVAPNRSWVVRELARWTLRRADYVTCVSEGLAQAAQTLGAAADRLEAAPWGIDTETFCPVQDLADAVWAADSSAALRQRLGLTSGPVVLSLRGVRPIYRTLDIAHSIPIVLAQVPEAQFVIRTYNYDPGLLARVQAVIQEAGVSGAVRYVGRQSEDWDIAALNRLADVGISVPASDGTPMSVLEALACGVAMIVSDLPSLHEWVEDQYSALFVPVGDVGALSNAIVRLLEDESLRKSLSEQGLRVARERADRKVWMRHYEAIYRRLIEEGPRGPSQGRWAKGLTS